MTTELAEIDAPEELKARAKAAAGALVRCETPEHFIAVANQIKADSAALIAADEFFDPPIAQAHALHKLLCQRKHVVVDPIKARRDDGKKAALGYQRAEQEKAEAERRRLQAIADEAARKEREKIEQARAKQAAIEAEQRAKAEAARRAEDEAKRQAEAASAAKRKKLLAEAEAARLEAEAAERKATAAQAKQEVQEEAAAAVVAPVIAVASAVPKIAGTSTRKTWKAEITDLAVFLDWCIFHKRDDLLLPNLKVLESLAKGLKERAAIPGVKFSEETTMAASGR